MLFAVLGSIRGDSNALDSALARTDSLGIHAILCTGNLVAGGDSPNEVVQRIQDRRIVCVQGLQDRQVVRALRKLESMRDRLSEDVFAAIQRAHEALTSNHVEILRALPQIRTVTFEGIEICLCHGTVTSQADSLDADTSLDRFRRQREAANVDLIVCGSDGEPFVRWIAQTLFVNPGSLRGDDGSVRIVVINTDTDPWNAEIALV